MDALQLIRQNLKSCVATVVATMASNGIQVDLGALPNAIRPDEAPSTVQSNSASATLTHQSPIRPVGGSSTHFTSRHKTSTKADLGVEAKLLMVRIQVFIP